MSIHSFEYRSCVCSTVLLFAILSSSFFPYFHAIWCCALICTTSISLHFLSAFAISPYKFLVSDYIDVPTFNLSFFPTPFIFLIHLVFFLIVSCYVQRHSIHGMMEEDGSLKPHQEIQALNFEEKKFLLAVERGDVAGTRR